MAGHITPNTGQMRSTVDWLHILTAQEKKTLHAMQGYVEVALRSEQLEAMEGMLCSINRVRCPLVPVGSCDWLIYNSMGW